MHAQIIRTLGNGTFGAVHLVEDAGGNQFAMKVLKMDKSLSNLEAEIANHKTLNHPHIVRYHEAFQAHDAVCMVMDLANSGSLFDLVRKQRRLSENKARWFFQQLIMAVDYRHKCGVTNHDIKLESLLLHVDPGFSHALLKMCDFGYSTAYRRSICDAHFGTPNYMAPELLTSFWAQKQYDGELTDIWSCGVVLYIMLYGTYPFDHLNDDPGVSEAEKMKRMLDRMLNESYRLYPEVPVSAECVDMLRGLLKPRPQERIRLMEILQHPWFRKNLPPLAMDMQNWYLQLRGAASGRRQQIVDESGR
ncbi:hypothetical protein Vretimale_10885 [Volvox reticuliferus]|uniref:Protein kinase domain-containing protein n=1 Tax=Volvox reticuliferus TaxID=1737510 RepID=A0A8J4CIN3_9CHLO|nr:hypothetical protein Vretifemale_12598 [Volvox reticuliferus]GIM06620.1 hypothetical protein Vretimale_10885 [Volvox reticuliferus]